MTNRRKSSFIINADTVDRTPEVDDGPRYVKGGHPKSKKTKITCQSFAALRKASDLMLRKQEIDATMARGGPGVLRNIETD